MKASYEASGLRITVYWCHQSNTGCRQRPPLDGSKYLYTVDLTTVETEVADLTTAWLYLKIDPATHKVTVSPSATVNAKLSFPGK